MNEEYEKVVALLHQAKEPLREAHALADDESRER